jgi:hypothetical protein
MEGKDRVATDLRYVPVKSKKLRRSLKELFKTTNHGASQGYWRSSDEPCSKAKGYSFLGRGMMLTQTGNQVAVFNDIGGEKFSGLATINQKYGRCDGTIEPVGKTKQVRLTCAWSEVDREQPDRDTYEARVTQGEHVFYLCRKSSRFP